MLSKWQKLMTGQSLTGRDMLWDEDAVNLSDSDNSFVIWTAENLSC